MVVREKWRLQAFRRSLRAAVKHPSFCCVLPVVGLCEVWAHDGKAHVFPGSGGMLRSDWFAFMRFVRRRRKPN